MNYDEKIVKKSASLEEAATMICSYGYYDTRGVSKEDVLKYMRLGAQWQKEQLMHGAIEGEIGDIMPLIEVNEMNNYLRYVKEHELKTGDKVKVLLIKMENEL